MPEEQLDSNTIVYFTEVNRLGECAFCHKPTMLKEIRAELWICSEKCWYGLYNMLTYDVFDPTLVEETCK